MTMRSREAEQRAQSRVRIEGPRAIVDLGERSVELALMPLPDRLLEWLRNGRQSLYDALVEGGSPVRFFAQHLPMVVTYSSGRTFPFNCGNKGVGFLPKAELLEGFSERYRATLTGSRGRPWQESLRRRVETVSVLNLDSQAIDRRCLVTLELFEKQTFRNVTKFPLASLLYTGHSPEYLSYQVNCVVEVVGPDDPRHTFVTLQRTMFEYDDFHITQHRFPYAYVFWVTECLDKTPHRTVDSETLAPPAGEGSSMPWDEEALTAVSRAPAMIREQVRRLVEVYARERGFTRVDAVVVAEAKRNLMDGR